MTRGRVVDVRRSPWRLLTVELEDGDLVVAHLSAGLRLRGPKVQTGDRVELQEVVPGRSRIVRRLASDG